MRPSHDSRLHLRGVSYAYPTGQQVLDGVDPGVQQQVPAGDAGVHGALADVDGDVARTQEEQLDVVGLIDEHELTARTAGAVARLGEHGDGGIGQGALVRDGDTQHGGS